MVCPPVAAPGYRRTTDGGVAFPLLAFEVYRLAVLGSGEAWLASWGEFRAFSAEQSGPWALRLVGEKLHSLHVTGPGLALGTAWALALAVRLAARPAGAPPQPGAGAVLPALWLGGGGHVGLVVRVFGPSQLPPGPARRRAAVRGRYVD